MPGKRYFRFLGIAILLPLAVILAVAPPGASADGDDDWDQAPPLPEKSELKYPNLGSHLDQLVARVAEGETSTGEAAEEALVHREESVAVTIHLSGNVDAVVSFLEENGGDPRNVGEDYVEAYAPVSLLGPLSEQPGVIRVREIVPPQPNQLGQSPVTAPRSRFAGLEPGRIQRPGRQGGGNRRFLRVQRLHGTYGDRASVNGAGQMLPGCGPVHQQPGRLREHNIWVCPRHDCRGDGHGHRPGRGPVHRQSSLKRGYHRGCRLDGSGRGIGYCPVRRLSIRRPRRRHLPVQRQSLNTIDRAVSGGITWVNAAGNEAEQTWFGGYSNADRDRWIEFNSFDETIDIQLEAEDLIIVELRWEGAWGGASSDFDLHLVDGATGIRLGVSLDPQSGGPGHVPHEYLKFVAPWDGQYHVAVAHQAAAFPAGCR